MSRPNDRQNKTTRCPVTFTSLPKERDSTCLHPDVQVLQERDRQFRQLAENLREVLWIASRNWKQVVYVSPAYETVWGRSRESLYEHPLSWLEAVVEEDRGWLRSEMQKRSSGDFSLVQVPPYRIRRPDGTVRWISVRAFPLRNEDGVVDRVAGIAEDITEQRQTEEALRQAEREKAVILDNMTETVVYEDRQMRVIWANRAAAESVGRRPEELVGQACFEIWHGRTSSYPSCPVARALKTGQPQAGEEIGPDGRVWLIRGSPVRDANGQITGVVKTALDITDRKRAQKALEESELKFKILFERSADASALLDNERFTDANQAAWEILGFARKEDLIGRHPVEISPPVQPDGRPSSDKVRELIQQARQNGSSQFEWRCRRPDGRELDLEITLTRIALGGKNLLYAVGRDITERKRAEDALKLTQFAMDHASESIYWIDYDARFVYVNDAACVEVGYTREELLGMTVLDIDPDLSPEQWRELWRIMDQRKFVTLETRHRTKEGRAFPVEVNSYLFSYGGKVLHCAFVRDITERKRVEEELRHARDDLEARVRERTAELIQSNTELARFAYVSSHDLQEPLRMVASYVGLLENEYRDKLDDNAREYIAYAIEGAQRMSCLIKGLLEYSQINTDENVRGPVDVGRILEVVHQNLRQTIENTGARITADPLPVIQSDKIQMVRVFQNLIDNAVKFHGNRVPEIHIGAQRQDHEWVFSVRDNGIGIEPEYFEKIFEIFQRLHRRRDYPGMGMGLAVVRRIIERHGGRIWIESRPGEGSTFFFTVPDPEPAAEANARARVRNAANARP